MMLTVRYDRMPHTDHWGYYAWADRRSVCYNADATGAVGAMLLAVRQEFGGLDGLAVDGEPCPDIESHIRAMVVATS